ncbi:3-hydroxyanthranilate 3,4-dioxygenase isoform X2 [Scyliorhinus canicula]|uniref:3-hydroxyanthranilate 3,4-dioxygenase isoform X2 n=1 Tax=Scyliorhinus canicula TaxID=7830 RepID=UPI0018F735D2|nr:3-hydroxyanthranilate 3,4-dioxygenase isoform X2 [Scyliorhinus canicula]
MGLLYNVDTWIEENKKYFNPPVCNKLMHSGQLKVVFVGGPNERKDYHIEEGEELFYQCKGDMCLKIIEKGKRKDVHIREGEMFLLPARIPHSPQRQANTVGLVFERMRLKTELDALRFFSSEECKTGKPNPDKLQKQIPFCLNTVSTVMEPFSLQHWLCQHSQDIKMKRIIDMFGDQFETKTVLYAAGESEGNESVDTWIWQLEGASVVLMDGKNTNLTAGDSLLIPLKTKYVWKRAEGTIALYVVQDPTLKKSYVK